MFSWELPDRITLMPACSVNCNLAGEVEFHIILAKVRNSFCNIAFCDKVSVSNSFL